MDKTKIKKTAGVNNIDAKVLADAKIIAITKGKKLYEYVEDAIREKNNRSKVKIES